MIHQFLLTCRNYQHQLRKFFDLMFQTNPLNSDLIALKNENAISRSIRNLILTQPGDKPFQPDLGSEVYESLFETLDQITASSVQQQIENTIIKYEPRVDLRDVTVTANIPNNAFDVLINYEIIGIEASRQQITFALELTR